MINTVVEVGDFVFFDVGEGKGIKRKDLEWMGGEDGEGLVGMGNVRVPDAFLEFYNHEFADRVLDVDAIGDAFFIVREIGVSGDRRDGRRWRYRVQYEVGGAGAREGSRGGVDVIHNVARRGSELKLSNFEGHKTVAGRLRRVGSR